MLVLNVRVQGSDWTSIAARNNISTSRDHNRFLIFRLASFSAHGSQEKGVSRLPLADGSGRVDFIRHFLYLQCHSLRHDTFDRSFLHNVWLRVR